VPIPKNGNYALTENSAHEKAMMTLVFLQYSAAFTKSDKESVPLNAL
jgi:hypothetical protein